MLLMSKGSKEALTVLIVTYVTHVERVERLHYVHNIDTFNAMSKWSKDYVMLKQGTYTFLLITFLIFNQFSIHKKFWKAETDLSNHTIQCYVCQRGPLTCFDIHSMVLVCILCMTKHVEGIKSRNNFQPLRHT